jgi:two-component system response regulator HydG
MGRQLKGFSQGAMDRLINHSWRGNVRELENEIERIAALAGEEEVITTEMLSEQVRGAALGAESTATGGTSITDWNMNRSVDGLKRSMILQAVRETGSKTRAAERLGIPRQSLQKMMKRLEIGNEELVEG